MKKKFKKLSLSTETLKNLTEPDDLKEAAGGATEACTNFTRACSFCTAACTVCCP
jgi:hypothetical protein